MTGSPLLDIAVGDGLWRDPPGTADPAPRKPLEVKLAADLGVWTTGVGDVITVEGHHVAQDVCARVLGWKQKKINTPHTHKTHTGSCPIVGDGILLIQQDLAV